MKFSRNKGVWVKLQIFVARKIILKIWPTNPSKKGVEAYYSPESKFNRESLEFSKILIKNQVGEVIERGEVKSANFKILRDIPIPGVLLELGYLTNNEDAAKLRDPEYQNAIAKAIYKGLEEIRSKRR